MHHELCFGCGRGNMFGLLLEAQRADDPASLTARCFIKQDHQGPDRSRAHPGVIAAALSEAISLLCGPDARVSTFEVTITGVAPVGTFLDLTAELDSRGTQDAHVVAAAMCDGSQVATASGTCSL
ncbi:MAG: hypothetical protein M3076_03710 [Actinomycetota bacterium]|nr:hypothetical protein [Actinomycetota bacterium]